MGIFNFFGKRKPNIIMINIDGGGREDALKKVKSYQELKKEAVFLPTLITYAPYSIGSMHAQISGMYGKLNGVNGYYKAYSFDTKNVYTLTQYLKDAGYHTEIDWVLEEGAPAQGFDTIRSYGKDESSFIDLAKRHSEILTQINDKQPFFLILDYNKIAFNMLTSVLKKYTDFSEEYFKNKEKNFSNYIQWLTESGEYVNQILNKLKELNLYDNSIIIIYSDHGCSVGDRIGEKAYGVYLYDYTIRCFAYIIAKDFPKNLEIKTVIRTIDILPTILDVLKIPIKKGYKQVQGKSFLPFIHGKGEERIAYSETGGLGGPTPSPEVHNTFAVRTNKWKLIYNETNKKKELYDLENDREEKNNLMGKEPEVEKYLWGEMEKVKNEGHT